MATEPEQPKAGVDVGQSDEERRSIIEELERMSPESEASPPLHRDEEPVTSDDVFAALQAQGLGSGALGTDPYMR